MKLLCVLFLLSTPLLAACSPWTTYPRMEGTVHVGGSTAEPVPTLIAEAIAFAYTRYGTGEPDFAISLPAGTPSAVYDHVIDHLGGGHPVQDPDEPTYYISKVMVRGLEGKVDLFYPKPDGSYQIATISFHRDLIRGYEHTGTRRWRTGDEPPPPHIMTHFEELESPVLARPEPAAPDETAPDDTAPDGETGGP